MIKRIEEEKKRYKDMRSAQEMDEIKLGREEKEVKGGRVREELNESGTYLRVEYVYCMRTGVCMCLGGCEG